MSSSIEKWVTLKERVPVFISYFTAWVNSEGLLNFRQDIYGHDKIWQSIYLSSKLQSAKKGSN